MSFKSFKKIWFETEDNNILKFGNTLIISDIIGLSGLDYTFDTETIENRDIEIIGVIFNNDTIEVAKERRNLKQIAKAGNKANIFIEHGLYGIIYIPVLFISTEISNTKNAQNFTISAVSVYKYMLGKDISIDFSIKYYPLCFNFAFNQLVIDDYYPISVERKEKLSEIFIKNTSNSMLPIRIFARFDSYSSYFSIQLRNEIEILQQLNFIYDFSSGDELYINTRFDERKFIIKKLNGENINASRFLERTSNRNLSIPIGGANIIIISETTFLSTITVSSYELEGI